MTIRNVSPNGPQNSGGTSASDHNSEPAPISETQQPSASQAPVVAGNLPGANRELGVIEERVGAICRVVMQVLEPLNIKVVPPAIVGQDSSNTSYYHTVRNAIYIHPRDVRDLDAYCEEVAHWARRMAVARLSNTPNSLTPGDRVAVDEFFGYLGRFAIPELCRDSGLDLSWDKSAVDQPDDIQSAERKWRERIDRVPGLISNVLHQSGQDNGEKFNRVADELQGSINALDEFRLGEKIEEIKEPRELVLSAQTALSQLRDQYDVLSKDEALPKELSEIFSREIQKIDELCRDWSEQARSGSFDNEEEKISSSEALMDDVYNQIGQVSSQAQNISNKCLNIATIFVEETTAQWAFVYSTFSHSAGYLSATKVVADTRGAPCSDLFLRLLPEPDSVIFRDYITYDADGRPRQSRLSGFVARVASAVRDFWGGK